MLRRNIYEHNAKIYRARKAGRSSPQRRSHLVVLTLRNLSPNRSQKRPIYHLNCESQARRDQEHRGPAPWRNKGTPLREAGVIFGLRTQRKTTPAASDSVASQYFLDDAASPPSLEAACWRACAPRQ